MARAIAVLPSLVLLAWGAAPIRAADDATPAPAPTPVLTATETTFDAGDIVEGKDPVFTFTLVNNSQEELKVKARPSCGCTVAKLDPVIAPGGRAHLEATLRTKGLRGRVTKSIVVQTPNAPGSILNLRITANIRRLIRVEPDMATYVPVRDEGATTTEFTLTPEPGQGIEFKEVVTNLTYIEAKLLPGVPDGPRKVQITITPDAPLGHVQALLTVVTNSEVTPRINLLITGEKGIGISPGMFYLGLIPENAPTAREEVLLTKSGGRFTIKSIESDDPKLEVKVEPVKEGVQYRLVATYTGGWKQGLVSKTVTVTTDDRRQPVLKIPVQAVVSVPNPNLKVGG